MKAEKRKKILIYIGLTFLAVLMIIPFYWMLISSVKLNKDVFSIPMEWIPRSFHFENYQEIWEKIPLLTFFKNSTKLTVITTIIQLATSCFAAYGFAKLEFKGRDFLFLAYVTTIAVPWQVYMVPQFTMMSKFGLNNTHIGLIMLHAFSAFGVFLMRQFFLSIPKELSEAARIDGLGEYGNFCPCGITFSKTRYCNLNDFYFCKRMERFHGPIDLLKQYRVKDNSAWYSYVYFSVCS